MSHYACETQSLAGVDRTDWVAPKAVLLSAKKLERLSFRAERGLHPDPGQRRCRLRASHFSTGDRNRMQMLAYKLDR
jgi:hypothetical protein